ncbi:MAG: OmpA family protein [Cyclobacteriaceae bacterium]
MLKAILGLFFTALTLTCIGQPEEEFVTLKGKVLNADDSSAASVSLFYEKLPYYDDMGMAKSSSTGDFEFVLIKGVAYSFRLTASGFIESNQEVVIADSDGDGVMESVLYIKPEEEDKAPELVTLENLIFARGSDRITESSHQELDMLAEYLHDNSTMVIQLEGHTDFAGNAEANLNLSQARVDAVKRYLVDKGVKKNRVLTKAFGGSQPLVTERTPEAKAKNRRVEARVVSK